jgi:hypothetical protein
LHWIMGQSVTLSGGFNRYMAVATAA